MNNWSVFHYSMRSRYYLRRPWKFFRETWFNIKYAWQRATRGYADSDVFDFCDWFLYVIPPMLQDLARDKTGGYPGFEPMDTLEKWTAFLEGIAADLISCREEEQDKRNEYYKEYIDSFEMNWPKTDPNATGPRAITWSTDSNHDEISHLYFAREKELYEESKRTLSSAFARMSEWFFALWS